jgi:hypothetical protein
MMMTMTTINTSVVFGTLIDLRFSLKKYCSRWPSITDIINTPGPPLNLFTHFVNLTLANTVVAMSKCLGPQKPDHS